MCLLRLLFGAPKKGARDEDEILEWEEEMISMLEEEEEDD